MMNEFEIAELAAAQLRLIVESPVNIKPTKQGAFAAFHVGRSRIMELVKNDEGTFMLYVEDMNIELNPNKACICQAICMVVSKVVGK